MDTQPASPTLRPGRPPGPRNAWFGLPALRAMGRDYLGFWAGQQRRHGDVVYMRLGTYRDYSFFHPRHVHDLLVASHEHLIRWERGIEVFASVHGASVLTAEGPQWRRQRQALQPAFSQQRIESFVPLMTSATVAALDRWRHAEECAFEEAMTLLTMEVILRSLFSHCDPVRSGQAADAVHKLGQIAMREMYWPLSAPLWMPWKAPKRRALHALDGLIRGELARRRAEEGKRPDLLQQLLDLRNGDEPALDEERLRDECMTIFLAGHETTAAALTWWGWCMAAHPQAQRRAADEADAVLGGRRPEAADLARLPWLRSCIRETLRLYPPAPALLTRRTRVPLPIDGWMVPAGATLRLTPAIIQRDPRWYEDPDAFRPERFDPASGHPPIPKGAWLPFGAGPRVCLGSQFAQTEMMLIAALILQRFRLDTMPDGTVPAPVFNVTLRPARALRLRLARR